MLSKVWGHFTKRKPKNNASFWYNDFKRRNYTKIPLISLKIIDDFKRYWA